MSITIYKWKLSVMLNIFFCFETEKVIHTYLYFITEPLFCRISVLVIKSNLQVTNVAWRLKSSEHVMRKRIGD